MKRIAALLPLFLLYASCSSVSNGGRGDQTLPNYIGMTVLVVGALVVLPISLPVIGVKKVYNDLSGVTAAREKTLKEQQEKIQVAVDSLKATLDPFYEARTRIIQERNPTSDATTLMADNIYFLLPFDDINPNLSPSRYPGLLPPENYNISIFNPEKAEAFKNPRAVEIAALLSLQKPEVEQAANKNGVYYMGDAGMHFRTAVLEYKKQFNQTMYNAKYQAIYHVAPPPPNPQKQF